jgi:hypothetical protein
VNWTASNSPKALDVIDYEHLDWTFAGFQFEAELFLDRRED